MNFTPLSAVERVVAEIQTGEEAAGKEPGASEVACRFFCIQGDPEQGLGLASWMFAGYATVPVYEQYVEAGITLPVILPLSPAGPAGPVEPGTYVDLIESLARR